MPTFPKSSIAPALALAVVLVLFYFVFRTPTPPPVSSVSDSPIHFEFEIASTTEARVIGLSGRSDVPEGYGMLFVFPEPGSYGIWMKDMLVAIDIIWLSSDGTVLGINHKVTPDTYPKIFYPPQPASYVLETRAGEAVRQHIDVGDKLPLP